jgi:hypothetical protein
MPDYANLQGWLSKHCGQPPGAVVNCDSIGSLREIGAIEQLAAPTHFETKNFETKNSETQPLLTHFNVDDFHLDHFVDRF